MMNHCVPDFEFDEDYSIHSSSGLARSKKSSMADDEIMELLWQNGPVVVQTQNQRSGRKSNGGGEAVIPNAAEQSAGREIRSAAEETAQHHLFMQEDEMASWLHYPLDDSSFERNIYSDLFYPPPPSMAAPVNNLAATAAPSREIRTSTPEIRPPPPPQPPISVAPRPPVPPVRLEEVGSSSRIQNFTLFSRLPKTALGIESRPSYSAEKESTVVESNETPMVGRKSRATVSHAAPRTAANLGGGNMSCNEAAGTSTTGRELATTCELAVTSSPGGSGASISVSAEPPPPQHQQQKQKQPPATAEDRKRKGREADDNEGHSLDIEFESGEAKKQARGSTSTKRSRAAEVHNLSERRRRDRINEKMKALQELIPRCNKSDKASMLDEAIEYLKSLQMQVQMMSMGCAMVPMMYSGVQQYMPAMGMGMGMGMGMDLTINRPMVPYPPLLPGAAMPNPAAAAHMAPRFPMPPFHMPPPVPVPDPSRVQAPNPTDPMLNSLATHNPHQPRHPNFVDPYQQYLLQQGQVQLPQNQEMVHPGTQKPGSSREVGNPEDQQPGG